MSDTTMMHCNITCSVGYHRAIEDVLPYDAAMLYGSYTTASRAVFKWQVGAPS